MTWTDIDRAAPVIVRHESLVAAPRETVWRLHTDVNAWPTWQPDIDTARLDGAFAVGNTFHWTTFGLSIPSTIAMVEPQTATLWSGTTSGITGVHRWEFADDPEGTRVTTEESWSGAPVEADVADARAKLDASVAAWVGYLRAAAQASR